MEKQSSIFSSIQGALGLAFGTTFVLGGIWCLIHPDIDASYGLLLMVLGSGIVGLTIQLTGREQPLAPQQLQQQGLGLIVAQIGASITEPLLCQHCGKSFHTPPLIQGSAYFCSETCKRAGHTRLEKPRFYLQPPLALEDLNLLLEQSIQFGERAMRAASSGDVDRPLMLATHRGGGAANKIKQVILSLKVYNQLHWAQQLEEHPPPEPLLQGGFRGSSNFFEIAREVQAALQNIAPTQNPFALFQLTEPVELSDLQKIQPYDQQSKEAYALLRQLLQEGETELQKIISPLGL